MCRSTRKGTLSCTARPGFCPRPRGAKEVFESRDMGMGSHPTMQRVRIIPCPQRCLGRVPEILQILTLVQGMSYQVKAWLTLQAFAPASLFLAPQSGTDRNFHPEVLTPETARARDCCVLSELWITMRGFKHQLSLVGCSERILPIGP